MSDPIGPEDHPDFAARMRELQGPPGPTCSCGESVLTVTMPVEQLNWIVRDHYQSTKMLISAALFYAPLVIWYLAVLPEKNSWTVGLPGALAVMTFAFMLHQGYKRGRRVAELLGAMEGAEQFAREHLHEHGRGDA